MFIRKLAEKNNQKHMVRSPKIMLKPAPGKHPIFHLASHSVAGITPHCYIPTPAVAGLSQEPSPRKINAKSTALLPNFTYITK